MLQHRRRNRTIPPSGFLLLLMLLATPIAVRAQVTRDTTQLDARLRSARTALNAAYASRDAQAASRFFADSAILNYQDRIITVRLRWRAG
jgi:hypothetical protein